MTEHRTLETGVYVGNQSARSILLPWQPAWLRVTNDKASGPASQRNTYYKIAAMASDLFSNLNTTVDLANAITITSTGFDVAADDDVNNSDVNYYWVAQKVGPWVDVGSYTGGGGTQSIVLGRQPVAVTLFQTTEPASQSERVWFKTSTMSTDVVSQMRLAITSVSELTIESTGFEVKGNADESGESFGFIAHYGLVGSTVHNRTGTYSGAGGSRSISLGAQPKSVTIVRTGGGGESVAFAADSMPTGNHGDLSTAHAWDTSTTGIVFVSDGFDVSSEFDVSGATYHWLAEMR